MFLEDLPHRGKLIDWKNSVGKEVRYVYDDRSGLIEIIERVGNNRLKVKIGSRVTIVYTFVLTGSLISKLAKMGVQHNFKVGEIVKTSQGNVEIIEQTITTVDKLKQKNCKIKSYTYKCCNCGYIATNIKEYNLKKSQGCLVCASKKIVIGINDLWTTAPNIAEMLKNKSEGYEYSKYSNKKLDWVCSECGNEIKQKPIVDIVRCGLSCSQCSDGVSYPEKFMHSVLEQLNVNFQTQLSNTTFAWCGSKRYDFFLPKYDCIIETHGSQHYTNKQFNKNVTLEDQKSNDKYKYDLATSNGINTYIIINARYSELEWIKASIIKSEMSELFDLSKIDWAMAEKYALSSRVKEANKLYNKGYSIEEIVKEMKTSLYTIDKYLCRGSKAGLSNYKINN